MEFGKSRRNGLFLDVPDEQWNDWKWQVKNRVETVDDLKKYMKLYIPGWLRDFYGEADAGRGRGHWGLLKDSSYGDYSVLPLFDGFE